jgi:hypothetical protein
MDRNVFKTELYWNTTNEFDAVDSSLSFIAETSTSVTGLLPETHFKLITYGTNGFIDSSSVEISTANLPVITGIAATTVDTRRCPFRGADLYIGHIYSDSSVFDASLGDVTTITDISDNSVRYLGLNSNTTYYVKVVPIGLDAYVGEYSSAVFAKRTITPQYRTTSRRV